MHSPFLILLIGIIVVVGGIIGFKLHPFLALILGAFAVATLTSGSLVEQYAISKGATPAAALQLSKKSIGERVALEFGNTCAKIGILIAMAAIIGKCLLESGAAERIVRSILQLTGMNKAPVAFLVSSFFLGIPVFFDAVVLLMIPLAKTISMRIGKNYLLFILAITGGAAMANSLVPPAPGPLFLAGEMQLPLGVMMIGGTLLGLITITAGYFYAVWANRKFPVPLRDSLDAKLADLKSASVEENAKLPALWFSLLPVLIPLLLICVHTAVNSFLTSDTLKSRSAVWNNLIDVIQFCGDKNTALLIGGLLALILLAKQKKGSKEGVSGFVQGALMSGGSIVLITAAGGAFGGMLQQTGISLEIAEMTKDYQMALIPLAFIITAVVRTAQGSATVALITASGILAGMAQAEGLAYHPLYIGLAIGCGSKLVPWMNDSGFWIICKMSNLTEKETLKTFSPMLTIMGITGLIVLLLAARFMPLI